MLPEQRISAVGSAKGNLTYVAGDVTKVVLSDGPGLSAENAFTLVVLAE
jgi:hypothetical protein